MLDSDSMGLSIRVIPFEEAQDDRASLDYWLSRPPQERLAEVERLRLEYLSAIAGKGQDGLSQGLRGSLLLVDRETS